MERRAPMKMAQAVDKLVDEYTDNVKEHEDQSTLDDNWVERLRDFVLYVKYSRDADVHDELAATLPEDPTAGSGRLHVLTEEEYATAYHFMRVWGPDYLGGMIEYDDFDTDEERENHNANMDAVSALLKRMEADRGVNVVGD